MELVEGRNGRRNQRNNVENVKRQKSKGLSPLESNKVGKEKQFDHLKREDWSDMC